MSNDQQQNEEKAPTIKHAYFIGGLIGVPISCVFNFAYIFWNMFEWWNFIYPVLLVMLGALVGVSIPSTSKYKWFGLFVGAILGAVASYYLLEMYIFF